MKVDDSFDVSDVVTRVLVVAQKNEEGHQKVEATVDGKTEYGVRQMIYTRDNKTSLEEAEKAAKKILEEKGDIKRKTSIESPDIPFLRKGDKIRINSSTGEGNFFVKSIRHNATLMKMTVELDEDKGSNSAMGIDFDTAQGTELSLG